jgi:hypothetical protein
VSVQGERFVLCGDKDVTQPGIDAVAQREINDPIGTAEIHGRFGTVFRQWMESFAGAAGKQNDESIVEFHGPGQRAWMIARGFGPHLVSGYMLSIYAGLAV